MIDAFDVIHFKFILIKLKIQIEKPSTMYRLKSRINISYYDLA